MRSFGRASLLVLGVCAALNGVLAGTARANAPHPASAAATARQSAARPGVGNPETLYRSLVQREERLRRELDVAPERGEQPTGNAATDLLYQMRSLAADYEEVARRFPRSGYSDNALWQAALLVTEGYWQFGDSRDKTAALRLFGLLQSRFPASSLVPRTREQVSRLNGAENTTGAAILRAIRREVLPDAIRVTLELEAEALFQDRQLDGPPRVFVDLQNTRAVPALQDVTVPFPDDVVRQVRIGKQADNRTRIVFDLGRAARYSAYSLYNPHRIVVDFERPQVSRPRTVAAEATPAVVPPAVPPTAATANTRGGFSLSRQLGLGISRIVIDPGHGGHDPGAKVRGLNEAELVLDIALRLEKLLVRDPDVAVVLTRRGNTYVALEERTAIANRSSADLFLSIHANASANAAVRGFETYVLNFAANPEAEALAARENAGSSRTMGSLPDIVKTIAMNNKIDESRDFATMLQQSLQERLRKLDRNTRSLGVKQAPFMVLLGATMPSALVEVSFLTNTQEAGLLRNTTYRQQIAEALLAGINKYQQSLKAPARIAAQ